MTQTPAYKAAIEAMAREIFIADEPNRAASWDRMVAHTSADYAIRNTWLKQTERACNALLTALPALGWQLVPVVATPVMLIEGGIAWSKAVPASETVVDCADACYVAALAAAPKFGGPDGEG
ncbi:hypothetical protein UFOVP1619_6 [uncultured Caudovirales phage]|uniref:Uncharacterized protein n=1 Tax=uncultured Caudovirales phage TaxID=2100421 RepID=A0A6J5SVP5_9CAUD|nr:hypothetical protein UFOVP1619_6 [uncultured Caudovirales phage]